MQCQIITVSKTNNLLFLGANKINPTTNQDTVGCSLNIKKKHHLLITVTILKLDEFCEYLKLWEDSISLFLGDGFYRSIHKVQIRYHHVSNSLCLHKCLLVYQLPEKAGIQKRRDSELTICCR